MIKYTCLVALTAAIPTLPFYIILFRDKFNIIQFNLSLYYDIIHFQLHNRTFQRDIIIVTRARTFFRSSPSATVCCGPPRTAIEASRTSEKKRKLGAIVYVLQRAEWPSGPKEKVTFATAVFSAACRYVFEFTDVS